MDFKSHDLYSFLPENSSLNSLLDTALDVSGNLFPLWLAVLLGLFVGWVWKPRWASLLFLGIKSRERLSILGFQRFWLVMTASVTAFQMLKEFWTSWRQPDVQLEQSPSQERTRCGNNLARNVIGDEDIVDLYRRFHYLDGGNPWEFMMDRSIPGMTYQAWRRDPQEGPTQYRSRTVFEDATPEIVKDYYWDDEFRHEWDDMIIYTKSLEACTENGAEIAHWIRKFPFFCSDREYLIGRRIYKCDGIYFCITKGVPYEGVPRRKKPRRVDVYSSCWCVRAAKSPVTGEMTACEVTFLHSEDMGIQRDIAKLGVRQGMWNCVKKMEPGLRKYQAYRKSTSILSFTASMAQLVTHVPLSFFKDYSEGLVKHESNEDFAKQRQVRSPWKWVVIGGAVLLACGLDRGVVGKLVVVGASRRLVRIGRRL